MVFLIHFLIPIKIQPFLLANKINTSGSPCQSSSWIPLLPPFSFTSSSLDTWPEQFKQTKFQLRYFPAQTFAPKYWPKNQT